MQRSARRREQVAALIEVHAIVGGAAVERAPATRHQATATKASEMVRNQTLWPTHDSGQLSDLAITSGQLDQQPPPQWMACEHEKWRHPSVRRTSLHVGDNTSNGIDQLSEGQVTKCPVAPDIP